MLQTELSGLFKILYNTVDYSLLQIRNKTTGKAKYNTQAHNK